MRVYRIYLPSKGYLFIIKGNESGYGAFSISVFLNCWTTKYVIYEVKIRDVNKNSHKVLE